MDSDLVKFKIPKNTSTKTPVFLVDFSNGQLNLSSSTSINFTSFKNGTDGRNSKAMRILVATSDRLTYKSASFEDEDNQTKLPVRYLVGVRNPNTGKMKIYECILLHLKPIIKLTVAPETQTDTKNYREKLDLLTLSFGNKAKKRSINARLKYSVDSSVTEDVLEDMSVNEPTHKNKSPSLLMPNTASGIDYIPSQNHEAATPSEVYNLLDIISEEEDEDLAFKANQLLKECPSSIAQWRKEGTYCKYVIAHLENEVLLEKAKYLIYYDYLVKFSKLCFSDFRKKDPAPEISEPYKSKLLDYFTISTSTETGRITRNCPKRMKDKLFSYIFVLALIIDDYCVNIQLVLNDFKRSLQSGVTVAQALGCHVIQRKVQDLVLKFAELKLPLFVPRKFFKK